MLKTTFLIYVFLTIVPIFALPIFVILFGPIGIWYYVLHIAIFFGLVIIVETLVDVINKYRN